MISYYLLVYKKYSLKKWLFHPFLIMINLKKIISNLKIIESNTSMIMIVKDKKKINNNKIKIKIKITNSITNHYSIQLNTVNFNQLLNSEINKIFHIKIKSLKYSWINQNLSINPKIESKVKSYWIKIHLIFLVTKCQIKIIETQLQHVMIWIKPKAKLV